MRYFVCPLGKINLGIPSEQTERIIPVSRTQTAVYETENDEAFISLPALLGQSGIAAPHGLILKTGEKRPRKTILLVPKIDIDLEIPEGGVHRLPEAFVGPLEFFSGACFAGKDENLLLVLDPKKIMEAHHD